MTGPHDHRHTVIMFDGVDQMGDAVIIALRSMGYAHSVLASVPVDECHGTDQDHREAARALASQLRDAADQLERMHP
jgi:predicted acylesterase/phospholipase RssA